MAQISDLLVPLGCTATAGPITLAPSMGTPTTFANTAGIPVVITGIPNPSTTGSATGVQSFSFDTNSTPCHLLAYDMSGTQPIQIQAAWPSAGASYYFWFHAAVPYVLVLVPNSAGTPISVTFTGYSDVSNGTPIVWGGPLVNLPVGTNKAHVVPYNCIARFNNVPATGVLIAIPNLLTTADGGGGTLVVSTEPTQPPRPNLYPDTTLTMFTLVENGSADSTNIISNDDISSGDYHSQVVVSMAPTSAVTYVLARPYGPYTHLDYDVATQRSIFRGPVDTSMGIDISVSYYAAGVLTPFPVNPMTDLGFLDVPEVVAAPAKGLVDYLGTTRICFYAGAATSADTGLNPTQMLLDLDLGSLSVVGRTLVGTATTPVNALNSGVIDHFRVYRAGEDPSIDSITAIRLDGTVSRPNAGGALELPITSVVQGDSWKMDSIVISFP